MESAPAEIDLEMRELIENTIALHESLTPAT
jgi:hypothetical protein